MDLVWAPLTEKGSVWLPLVPHCCPPPLLGKQKWALAVTQECFLYLCIGRVGVSLSCDAQSFPFTSRPPAGIGAELEGLTAPMSCVIGPPCYSEAGGQRAACRSLSCMAVKTAVSALLFSIACSKWEYSAVVQCCAQQLAPQG